MHEALDLTSPAHAYMFGFMQADGHLHKGRGGKGKLVVELSSKDKHILHEFADIIKSRVSIRDRKRRTNYSASATTSILCLHDKATRDKLESFGLPAGVKSYVVDTPTVPYSKQDYFRGWVDANGSLGITAAGIPFISLTTASDHIADAYKQLILAVTGAPCGAARNSRDNIYNICLFKEAAQDMTRFLDWQSSISLNRKALLAGNVLAWERPPGMRKTGRRRLWTEEEDAYILCHGTDESAARLGRSAKGIGLRLWRLKSGMAS
jgi:hypothetical protein